MLIFYYFRLFQYFTDRLDNELGAGGGGSGGFTMQGIPV
jgi:hypothetical protein